MLGRGPGPAAAAESSVLLLLLASYCFYYAYHHPVQAIQRIMDALFFIAILRNHMQGNRCQKQVHTYIHQKTLAGWKGSFWLIVLRSVKIFAPFPSENKNQYIH